MNFAELPYHGRISLLQSCMVAWAGLDPSNVWFHMLNRHFSNSIFDLFLTGHSKNKRANRKLKILSPFLESKVPAHPTFFELQVRTWRNVLDSHDDDADWLLRGAMAEQNNWRSWNFLRMTRTPSASRKICWARHQDGPQASYEFVSLSSDPTKKQTIKNWAYL